MSLGTVNLNDVIYPIRSLALRKGQFEIVIVSPMGEPLDIGDGSYFVFGSDGQLVVRGRITERWGEKALESEWVIHLSMGIDDKLGNKARKLLGA